MPHHALFAVTLVLAASALVAGRRVPKALLTALAILAGLAAILTYPLPA